MANPQIKLKRSAVAGKRPNTSNLDAGELALNTYDGKLFVRQDTGGVGIATTATLINPWDESFGGNTISYGGNISVSGVATFANTVLGTVNVSGVSTLGNTTIGGGTTELVVGGDANIVGMLTVRDEVRVNGDLNITGIITGTATIAETLIASVVENTVEHKILDNLSQSFDGVTTQFVITSDGAGFLNGEITTPARLMISVGGIVQQPDISATRGFTVTAGTNRTLDPLKIIFAEPPKYGEAFFGVAYGLGIDSQNVFVTANEALVNSIVFGV